MVNIKTIQGVKGIEIGGINIDSLNILIYWFARIILITVVYQFILIFVAKSN